MVQDIILSLWSLQLKVTSFFERIWKKIKRPICTMFSNYHEQALSSTIGRRNSMAELNFVKPFGLSSEDIEQVIRWKGKPNQIIWSKSISPKLPIFYQSIFKVYSSRALTFILNYMQIITFGEKDKIIFISLLNDQAKYIRKGKIMILHFICHNNLLVFQMGNIFCCRHEQTIFTTDVSMINQSPVPQFHSNKSKDVLMKQVYNLLEKISQVPYQWTKNLFEYLRGTHPDQIYAQYQRIFYYNCRRDKRCEDIFLAFRLRKIFLLYIPYQYNTKNCTLSPQQLKEVLHQAKCYFMVMGWLQSITLDCSIDRDSEFYAVFRTEEKVYDFLIEIAAKTYTEHLAKERMQSKDFYFSAQYQNCKVAKHLEQISQGEHFHDREKEIISLQQTLLSQDQQSMDRHLCWISKMFGKGKIFGNLLLIREVGHNCVPYLWEKFYGDTHNDLLQ